MEPWCTNGCQLTGATKRRFFRASLKGWLSDHAAFHPSVLVASARNTIGLVTDFQLALTSNLQQLWSVAAGPVTQGDPAIKNYNREMKFFLGRICCFGSKPPSPNGKGCFCINQSKKNWYISRVVSDSCSFNGVSDLCGRTYSFWCQTKLSIAQLFRLQRWQILH
jgi:hypothetical protein